MFRNTRVAFDPGQARPRIGLVNLYVEQVRATGGFPYATFSRVLKPLHERAYFHLVYATRSPKGIEKFREVEKRVVTEQQVSARKSAARESRAQERSGRDGFWIGCSVERSAS